MSTQNALLTILIEKISNDTLILPTLPEAALKIRKAADDPDINLIKMAEVIGQDPALSARMIKIANSAFLGRTIKVETLIQAVTRIGLIQIKNIATALAMEQLFVSRNEIVRDYIQNSWDKTTQVATVAITVLNHFIQHNKRTQFKVDTATLAGLVHNIGVLPILTEAERHEAVFAKPEFLEQVINKLAGRIGGKILRAWGFTEDFCEIAEKWEDLTYQRAEVSYIDFIRIGAIYCGSLGNENNKNKLLDIYVEKGILPDLNFFNSDEFRERFVIVRNIFN